MSVTHLAGSLSGHGVDDVGQAVLEDDFRVEHEVVHGVLLAADVESVGHERVPVIQVVKLGRDAVLILEAPVKEQLRAVGQLEVVVAEVLHVFLDHNLDGFSCEINK